MCSVVTICSFNKKAFYPHYSVKCEGSFSLSSFFIREAAFNDKKLLKIDYMQHVHDGKQCRNVFMAEMHDQWQIWHRWWTYQRQKRISFVVDVVWFFTKLSSKLHWSICRLEMAFCNASPSQKSPSNLEGKNFVRRATKFAKYLPSSDFPQNESDDLITT